MPVSNNQKNSLRLIRRRVRRQHVLPGGTVQHVTRSFSNDRDVWHPSFDLSARTVFCDCPDFTHRCARHEPGLSSPAALFCKHLVFAVLNAVRRGDLSANPARIHELEAACQRGRGFSRAPEAVRAIAEAVPTCLLCGEAPTLYPLCDEAGNFLSASGFCGVCALPQCASEEDKMRADVAAYSARFASPATLESVEKAADQCLAYQRACNDAWGGDNLLLIELREARSQFAFVAKTSEDPQELEVLAARIDKIEREHPFLEDPDFGVEDGAPFPELL